MQRYKKDLIFANNRGKNWIFNEKVLLLQEFRKKLVNNLQMSENFSNFAGAICAEHKTTYFTDYNKNKAMNILIVVLLALAGVLLLVLELFLIPGFGIAGIAGGGCLVGAVAYAYVAIGATAGHITFFVALAATAIAIYIFYKSRAIEKMSLDTKIDDKVELAAPGKKIERLKEAESQESSAKSE